MVTIKGGVELTHLFFGMQSSWGIFSTDHNAVGTHKVFYCSTFFEELRIGDYRA